MKSELDDARHHVPIVAARIEEAKLGCPKPPKSGGKKAPRKIVEAQLKDIIKCLISWRDGQQCVVKDFDGGRCNQILEWCHVIPQAKSYWLKWNLSNVFWGCGNHNLLDHLQDPVYQDWYINAWGIETKNALRAEMIRFKGMKQTVAELRELLDKYTGMYENRPAIYDQQKLIELGYYGPQIQDTWERRRQAEAA